MSTTYDVYQKVWQVIDWLGQGQTLTRACDDAKIGIALFEKTVAGEEDLKDAYDDAVRRGHDALADALINIDNHRIHGHSDARMANVISANIKWFLSKADPRRFADRLEVKHELTMDRAIVDALSRAKDRTDVIDADYLVMRAPLSVTHSPLGPIIEDMLEDDEEDDDAILRSLGVG